jgi:soluble lytic murein transglycosylase
MPKPLRSLLLLLAALLLSGPAVQADDDADATRANLRQAFQAAMAAASLNPYPPEAGDPEALQRYPLYPYLQAARLNRRLALRPAGSNAQAAGSVTLDDEIAALLTQQGDRPVTRTLRSNWLQSLASRKDWERYLAHFDVERDKQAVLRCHGLAARAATGRTAGLVDDIAATWLSPKSLPDECDPAIAWWQSQGGPDATLTERRARLALEAGEPGLARYLAKSLPPAKAAPLLQWAALIERPATEMAALIATPERAVEPAALADGWMRLARADGAAAADQFPALVQARRLDPRAQSPLALSVALALAWSRDGRALDFFRRVHADDFDERGHEWHARAALWAGDWKLAAAAIAAMPEALRKQTRWQYWSARTSEKLGNFARARELYEAVIPTDNWYAVHAAARLDRAYAPVLEPLGLDGAAIAAMAREPALERTRELLRVKMDAEAAAEWRDAFDALPVPGQVQAVGLASRWGWHHQAIASAAKLKLFNDYDVLYPRPFDEQVRAASRRTGLPESLIYAIIRQESLFRADAASSAGAIGLMQLLPETARLTAKRVGLPAPTRAQLTEPAVNVPLGSAFLASLVQRFEGETALATAGYNAGPNAARRWLPPAPIDLDVWAENIPFNETRAYVQRVAWHAVVFEWLDHRKPRPVKDWLRVVQPPPAAAATGDFQSG